MSQTSRNAQSAKAAGQQAETPRLATPVATPWGMEQSVLLWRVRKELARLQRIGDWQAYQDMLAVVAPVLDEQQGTQKASEASA